MRISDWSSDVCSSDLQFMPTGGYGMNTGVGDAVDLGWKLAAVIHGWGGPALLRSYEEERRPIAIQNRAASRRHLDVNIAIWSASPAPTDDDKDWDHLAEEIEQNGRASCRERVWQDV